MLGSAGILLLRGSAVNIQRHFHTSPFAQGLFCLGGSYLDRSDLINIFLMGCIFAHNV